MFSGEQTPIQTFTGENFHGGGAWGRVLGGKGRGDLGGFFHCSVRVKTQAYETQGVQFFAGLGCGRAPCPVWDR